MTRISSSPKVAPCPCSREPDSHPHLYAFDEEAGVIVMEDITGAQTVERVLFGSDPKKAARDALVRLASTVGSMHAVTTPMDSAAWNPAYSPLVAGFVENWKAA